MAQRAPKRQREEAGSNATDVARKGLVSLNNLDYVLQPDLSVATSRTMKRHFFQQRDYKPGNDAICILNSGAEYIDPQHTYLTFEVENKATDSTIALGCGSAVNFIQRVVLTSRSGDEIERVEDVNKLSASLTRYIRDESWMDTVGSAMGFGKKYDAFTLPAPVTVSTGATYIQDTSTDGVLLAPGHTRRFIVPLSELYGFYKINKLAPSMLMSGLRHEIHFANANDVGYNVYTVPCADGVSATDLNWEIKNISIMADSYQLTDSIQRVLNEEAAINGLEIPFMSFYHHHVDRAGESGLIDVNVELRKAVSRASGVLLRNGIGARNQGPSIDPFLCKKEYSNETHQLRVGSLYFPQQPTDNEVETYYHTLRSLGKLKTPSAPGSVSLANFRANLAITFTDLERSTTQKLSGIPVNNSRVAEIRGKHNFDLSASNQPTQKSVLVGTNLPVASWRTDVYIHYVRLLRVFLQNVEVEE